MTREKLNQLLKEYKANKNEALTREDFRQFTLEHEVDLGFSCKEIQNDMDRYMIARIDGRGGAPDGKKLFVSVIFNWGAIPDELEEFETDDEFIDCLQNLIDKVNTIKGGTIKI